MFDQLLDTHLTGWWWGHRVSEHPEPSDPNLPGVYMLVISMQFTSSTWGSPGGSDGEESTCDARDRDLIPGSGRSLGGGNGYPLQCSCLEESKGRGAWWAPVCGVAKSLTWLRNELWMWHGGGGNLSICKTIQGYGSGYYLLPLRSNKRSWLYFMVKLLLFCLAWLFSLVSAFFFHFSD